MVHYSATSFAFKYLLPTVSVPGIHTVATSIRTYCCLQYLAFTQHKYIPTAFSAYLMLEHTFRAAIGTIRYGVAIDYKVITDS